MKDKLKEIQEALLTGVSYMLPFVISGGLLIAIGRVSSLMQKRRAHNIRQCIAESGDCLR